MKKFIFIGVVIASIVAVIALNNHLRNAQNNILEPGIVLYLHNQKATINLSLEEYVTGSLAAEMPASFEMEALKAQAVCARTYALRKIIEKHQYPENADLSDDINSCQAFVSPQDFKKSTQSRPELIKRIKTAVESTRGEIMIFDSEPIDALYHSTCGGRTESALASGGHDVPYLQSVKCKYCKDSSHFKQEFSFDNSYINSQIGDQGNILNIKIIKSTTSGRPQKVKINQHEMYANTLRNSLNLPSNWMSFHIKKQKTIIQTRGYGHGIGMCQYGANGMAKSGKTYHQILKEYYKGIDYYKLSY